MSNSLIPELPDFSDPLSVLRACHDRMLEHCRILDKLVPHIADKGVDDEARAAIARVVHYFSTSAVHHHQDEEEDLFPVINRQSLKLADLIYRLRKEHEQLAALWEQITTDLKKGSALAEDADFPAHVKAFCSQYREHIDLENSELLGIAAHILSYRQLEELGRAMAKRRR